MDISASSPYFGAWEFSQAVFVNRDPATGIAAAIAALAEQVEAKAVQVEARSVAAARSAVLLKASAGRPPGSAVDEALQAGEYVHSGTWHLMRLEIGLGCVLVAAFDFGQRDVDDHLLGTLRNLLHVIRWAAEVRITADIGPRRLREGAFDLTRDWATGTTQCAILFADVRGFSTFTQILNNPSALSLPGAEPREPRELIQDVCKIFGDATSHYGWLDKLMGDGAMIVFYPHASGDAEGLAGAPADVICALRAVCTALHMRDAVRDLVRRWQDEWISDFHLARTEALSFELAVGINYGVVYRALFGPSWRQSYTVFGDAVVLAKRLEEWAGRDPRPGVLVSAPIAARLRIANAAAGAELVQLERLPAETLKGSAHPQEIWAVLGRDQCLCAQHAACSLCGSTNTAQ